ncbi:MAG: hypothetical protein JSU01_10375 [Bacteroidetes bacterium]|nr:hypothetical protein [Bacteroidota bacterium]
MKPILITFLTIGIFAIKAYAQDVPTSLPPSKKNPVRIEYADTVALDSVSREVLFQRSLDFIKKYYSHPKQVIKTQWAMVGTLTGSADFNAGKGVRPSYEIKIVSTDKGYYYSFFFISYTDDFVPNVMRTLSVTGSSGIRPKDWIVVSKKISDTMTDLITKLKRTMAGQKD